MTSASILQLFEAALASALATAATAATDRAWQAQSSTLPANPQPTATEHLDLAFEITGDLHGILTLRLSTSDADLLTPNTPDPATLWRTLAESAAMQLAQALPQHPFTLRPLPSSPTDTHPLTPITLRANDEFTSVTVHPLADHTLAAALNRTPRPSVALARTAAPIDRVVDVPLAVTIRFGQRQLLLRDLLELTAGALLELDRQVEEPVDLMLGERVIARGEVVIVDGNYGMRVTEVLENAARPTVSRDRFQSLSYATA